MSMVRVVPSSGGHAALSFPGRPASSHAHAAYRRRPSAINARRQPGGSNFGP